MVKERLWNGGFDRLEKYGDISRYSPQQRTIILNSNPKIETSVTLGEQPGTGTYRETYSINKDVLRDYTLQQSSDVKAHEMVHYMYRPSKEQEAELAYNVRQYFKRPEGRDYFRQSRATEQTARGTQIKNYYGLNEGNQDITPAMWDIMEELGIAVDKSFIEPCDLTPPTLEELCRMFGVNSLEELRNMPPSPMAF